ncbi:MAG: DUF5655 domain-containing protein [archaeon]
MEGKRFRETKVAEEDQLERIVKSNCKTLFGSQSIYFDLKNRIESRTLGAAIPDGFLFDFRDPENPEFYLIEIELEKHDFYKHIFPQITKFFAFFKNPPSRENLVERLFHHITSDSQLEEAFKSHLGKKEIYKTLKEIVENSQNILLILDGDKTELREVSETYMDTWGKIVTVEILKQYIADGRTVLTLNPDFEDLELGQPEDSQTREGIYTETIHTQDVDKEIIKAYESIKSYMLGVDPEIRVNPQKYYISLRKSRNFAFLKFKKRKLYIVIMLPLEEGSRIIRKHKITQLSQGVQQFYNGPCFKVLLENSENLDEIEAALKESYSRSR